MWHMYAAPEAALPPPPPPPPAPAVAAALSAKLCASHIHRCASVRVQRTRGTHALKEAVQRACFAALLQHCCSTVAALLQH